MPAASRQSRDPLERYYSRPEFFAPLAAWMRLVVSGDVPCSSDDWAVVTRIVSRPGCQILAVEPCVGHGAIIEGAYKAGISARWRTIDIDPDARAAQWVGNWLYPPATWEPRHWPDDTETLERRWYDVEKTVSLVVTNPPFSRALEIVKTAWERHPSAVVAILQRQTWHEPTRDRADFFAAHPPDVITIGRCQFVDGRGHRIRGSSGSSSGDTTSYAWHIWGTARKGIAGGMTRIIPWRQR